MGSQFSCVKVNKKAIKGKIQNSQKDYLVTVDDENEEVTAYYPPPAFSLNIKLSKVYQRRTNKKSATDKQTTRRKVTMKKSQINNENSNNQKLQQKEKTIVTEKKFKFK